MEQLHVGSGTQRGALTVFPVWGEYGGWRGYTTHVDHMSVAELADGPSVGVLSVTNGAAKPLLVLEGQILEGGWQNRMLARSVLVPASASAPVQVVCVEQGRWSGDRAHRTLNRRGSARVRAGLRSEDRQSEVWRRVGEYDGRLGRNETASFTEHADRAHARVRGLIHGIRPLPGQSGVVIGLAGHPICAEVFDSPYIFARQFQSILTAAAMDALWLPPVPTPGRRVRRFIARAGRVPTSAEACAGVGVTLAGRDEYADIATLEWRHRSVHTIVTNPRHELVAA